MAYSILKRSAVVCGFAAIGLALSPVNANAFSINYKPITGDARAHKDLTMSADVLIEQGLDAGLEENEAKWQIALLDQGDVVGEKNVGFKAFGFNVADRIAGKINIQALTPNWTVRGNGTNGEKISGGGNMYFDYVYETTRGVNRSPVISFLTTFSDGDALTNDSIVFTDFTEALQSVGAGGQLTGQVAGHVIGFKNAHTGSGIVAGEVPTPALLPGLIGMGVAAMRKRKGSEEDIQTSES